VSASRIENPFLQHAEMHLLRGALDAALGAARMGLMLSPTHPELLAMAANCAAQLGEDELAVTCWQQLLAVEPTAADAGNSLGLLLERLGRIAEAEAVFRQALAVLPDDASLQSNLGLLLENSGRYAEAESCLRQAVALSPDSPNSGEILSNLAGLLARLDQVAEAESLYRRAIALQPDFAIGHSNLGVLYTVLLRHEEAEQALRRALALQPDNLQAQSNMAQLLLSLGRWREAWPLHEGRQLVFAGGSTGPAAVPPACPQWQGESLLGKAIVVLPEQGLGDEIQFCRYLAWLKAQGPRQLTLVCRPAQKALMQTLAGPDVVLGLDEAAPFIEQHDYWVFLLSLPLHAGTTPDTIPGPVPYLFADRQRQQALAPWLAGAVRPAVKRVGVVWRGNPGHTNDADRSLPGLHTLAPLWAVDGVRFFSLQIGAQASTQLVGQPLVDLAPAIETLADSAALLSQLDLLISVDTSMAHLAGALGVPCWILLPRYKTDWRWLQGRSDSPWYPLVRLFRQQGRGDWRAPVDELAAALAAWAVAD
jgi:tetratricopeptide (TPR) repeat protein